MKIAVITRHAIANYGSLLQTMATQQVIEDLGHSCEIINYVRKDESCLKREKTLLKRKPEWNRNPLKRFLYLLLRQPESIVAMKKFEREQKKYLKLGRKYTSVEELIADKPVADIFMTGSDQVWGPVEDGTYDSAYCLSFTTEKDKRISYAASFGHTDLSSELVVYYKRWLSRYAHIAVREESAVEILSRIGLNTAQVLDPSLLLGEEYWSLYFKPISYEKYILVYQLHNDKKLGRYAKRVAKERGLPLVRVSLSLHQIVREGKFIWAPGMGAFLTYIKNAECLITDSFHGTAFAINFNTPFVEILPNNNTGTRNISVLQLTGLSERILQDEEDVTLASRQIDFSYANQVLKNERIKSLNILNRMIEE